MSKFVKDVKGFLNFFNELRKERPWTFYAFTTVFALGIAASVGSVLLLGIAPAIAMLIAFGGLYLGAISGFLANGLYLGPLGRYLVNGFSEGFLQTARDQAKFLNGFRESHPILFWGILASLCLAPLATVIIVSVPALSAFIMGNAIANYLGITAALSTSSLIKAVMGIALWGGVAASFALQGVVDIAKDMGSCFGSPASNKGFQTSSASQSPIYVQLHTDEGHPASAFNFGNPVFGAGGTPTAAVTASSASGQAPTFAKK